MKENKAAIDRIQQWIRESTTLKMFVIGVTILFLLIPAALVSSLVSERMERRNQVIYDIDATWGQLQTLNGPILALPFNRSFKNPNGTITTSVIHAYLLPKTLNITGNIDPDFRYRGIFKTVVYTTSLEVQGQINSASIRELGIDEQDILWDKAKIFVGIPDMRGLKDMVAFKWNSETSLFGPGVDDSNIALSGLNTKVRVSPNKTYDFSFTLNLKGSAGLYFTPLGETTNVSLRSSWKDPAFKGAFLPETRDVNNNGFEAAWKVLYLNRNFPQQWTNEKSVEFSASAFGVDLLIPVDHYSNTSRSIKYAVLFIFLTFLIFFFIEHLNKKRLHPIQYLLVGSALIVFYLLLLSLSEFMPFGLAYAIGSLAVVALIAWYTHGSLKDGKITRLITGFELSLYVFLYFLLQLQDYALLVGSLGLFAILAGIMYITRKFNWYGEA